MKPGAHCSSQNSNDVKGKANSAIERGIPDPPATSLAEWTQLAIQLLDEQSAERTPITLFMCEEAAKALLEGANRGDDTAQTENGAAPSSSSLLANAFGDVYTPVEVESDMLAAMQEGVPTAAQRLEAAQLLVAGSRAGLARGVTESTEQAVRLAKKAIQEYPSPMTYTALAWALFKYTACVPGRSTQDVILASAATAANSGLALLLNTRDLDVDNRADLVRLSWLMGLMRDTKTAELGVRHLLRVNSEHYVGMLLLALLHTVSGDYSSARSTVACLLKSNQEDIVAALLHIVLRQVTQNVALVPYLPAEGPLSGESSATSVAYDVIGKELAIILARVEAYSAKVASQQPVDVSSGDHTTPSLKELCRYRVLGERSPGDEVMDTHAAQRQAAHYWSLLAYVCVRLGAYTFAEVAIEAGMNFIAKQKTPHSRAFADLLCSGARLSLLRLGARLPIFTMVCELNLLGSFMPSTKVAPPSISSSTGENEVRRRGSVTNSLKVVVESIDHRELATVFTHLLQVVEMCPNHADAHFLMGTLRLLDASQLDLPKSEKYVKLLEAAVYFEKCIERSPFCVESYLGLGVVRKVQKADEVALDLYATATELWFRQPLISFEEFMFLFD
ncbi:unnamed protein product [Phytomonas sp. EM1]|nr:unnamed protein product [Phytomonas sp. EM1]|eukprot:CCW60301.1 unnamed protein product [Phytomonas sp. isolate EM1]